MTETTLQERLRRQAEAQNKYNVWLGSIIEEAADALDAKDTEIARLREALERISTAGWEIPYDVALCKSIARKALEDS